MTINLAGNHAAAATGLTANCAEITTAGSFDPSYTSSAYSFSSSGTTSDAWTFALTDPAMGLAATITSGWLHFEWWCTNGGLQGGTPSWALVNSTGVIVLKGVAVTATTNKAQYWNGASYVDTGAVFNIFAASVATRAIVDVFFTLGATGNISVFINNSLAATGSIASASANNFKTLSLGATIAGTAMGYSQVLVKSTSTVLRKVADRLINATGNYSAWAGSGTITNVNKVPFSDATFINDNVNGDKASFKLAALTVTPTNQAIEAVVINARVNNDGSGIANIRGLIRESATDYDLGYNFSNVGLGLAGNAAIFQTDPATGVAWAVAAANSTTLEVGLIAET